MADRPQDIDVFISYKREERALADRVSAALTAQGYTAAYDVHIESGEHFGDAIDRRIRDARLVVVLWTQRRRTRSGCGTRPGSPTNSAPIWA